MDIELPGCPVLAIAWSEDGTIPTDATEGWDCTPSTGESDAVCGQNAEGGCHDATVVKTGKGRKCSDKTCAVQKSAGEFFCVPVQSCSELVPFRMKLRGRKFRTCGTKHCIPVDHPAPAGFACVDFACEHLEKKSHCRKNKKKCRWQQKSCSTRS